MMKKILFTIVLVFTSVLYTSAQDMKEIIAAMPESIIYGLGSSEKTLLASGLSDTTRTTVSRGRLGQVIRLAASADFMSLKTSDAGTTEIKLLPLINDTRIICVIRTVCANMCDSRIQFYTTKWMPIPQEGLFPEINKEMFLKPGVDKSSQDFINAYVALDASPFRMELSPSGTSLKVYYDIDKYLNKEDYEKIKPFLIDNPLILSWDKSSFK